jgi:hypothetical protein
MFHPILAVVVGLRGKKEQGGNLGGNEFDSAGILSESVRLPTVL